MTTPDSTAQPQVDLAEKIYRWLLWATRIVMDGVYPGDGVDSKMRLAGLDGSGEIVR